MKRKKKPSPQWLYVLLPVVVGRLLDVALNGGLDWLQRLLG